MKPFRWDKHFLTGIIDVDDQHKDLVNLINDFGELISEGDTVPKSGIDNIIQNLGDYAKYHFSTEERMMLDIGIDQRHFIKHSKAHNKFIKDVTMMYSQLPSDDPKSAETVLEFLIYWLAYHILGTDHFMAKQISFIKEGMDPAEAYNSIEKERKKESKTEPLLVALKGLFRQVSERNRELIALNESLEQKVDDRTKELVAANMYLEQMAMTDLLTKIPNRRHAMQSLNDAWKSSSKDQSDLSLIIIDADGFKEINDNYGHDAGDEVLITLSRHLMDAFRTDDIVCRMGGDEFMVICRDTPLDGALHIAEIARKSIHDLKVAAGDGYWHGSISLGVATRSPEMNSKEDLIKAADKAVYMAKENGRNQVCTHTEKSIS